MKCRNCLNLRKVFPSHCEYRTGPLCECPLICSLWTVFGWANLESPSLYERVLENKTPESPANGLNRQYLCCNLTYSFQKAVVCLGVITLSASARSFVKHPSIRMCLLVSPGMTASSCMCANVDFQSLKSCLNQIILTYLPDFAELHHKVELRCCMPPTHCHPVNMKPCEMLLSAGRKRPLTTTL